MPPRLLDKLTDELLVVASDVVTAVAAEEQPLSGNSALRLLAWTVGDARGATVAMDKQLALTVGKRLDRQAQSVRGQLTAPSERAAEQRRELASSGRSAAFVAEARAEIDAAERAASEAAHTAARGEVYVGFHELEQLLPVAAASADVQASDGETPSADDVEAPAYADTAAGRYSFEKDLHSIGCYFPWALVEDYQKEDCSMPPDLIKSLGPDAAQVMQDRLGAEHCLVGEQWWSKGLPLFVKLLLQDLENERKWHKEDLELEKQDTRRAEQTREQAEAELEEAENTIGALRGDLRQAAGREEALHKVIHDCRWG